MLFDSVSLREVTDKGISASCQCAAGCKPWQSEPVDIQCKKGTLQALLAFCLMRWLGLEVQGLTPQVAVTQHTAAGPCA